MVEATVEEMVGFISGNVKRKQIIDVLEKNGAETEDTLGKLTRLPRVLLEKSIKDMAEKGIVKKQKDKYVLTENGKAAATVLHSMR